MPTAKVLKESTSGAAVWFAQMQLQGQDREFQRCIFPSVLLQRGLGNLIQTGNRESKKARHLPYMLKWKRHSLKLGLSALNGKVIPAFHPFKIIRVSGNWVGWHLEKDRTG